MNAQQYVLIEKSGTPRTERLKLYDEITFKLEDGTNNWHTRQILGLNTEAQMILFSDAWLPLSDLTRLKLHRQRTLANVIGGSLQGGGASMFLGDAYYTIRNRHGYTDGGMEFGLLNIVVGGAIRKLLGPIKYKLGGHRRLRIVDLTF